MRIKALESLIKDESTVCKYLQNCVGKTTVVSA